MKVFDGIIEEDMLVINPRLLIITTFLITDQSTAASSQVLAPGDSKIFGINKNIWKNAGCFGMM